jgi:hypothetical protein
MQCKADLSVCFRLYYTVSGTNTAVAAVLSTDVLISRYLYKSRKTLVTWFIFISFIIQICFDVLALASRRKQPRRPEFISDHKPACVSSDVAGYCVCALVVSPKL